MQQSSGGLHGHMPCLLHLYVPLDASITSVLICRRCSPLPQVAAFVSVLDKDLSDRVKTAEVDLEPVLAASYSSLITQEAARRLKAVPMAFYTHLPATLLSNDNCFSSARGEKLAGWVV